MKQLITSSAEETIAAGREIAMKLHAPALVLLKGDLGAGKTTLTKGIINKVAHGPISELRRQAALPDGHFFISTIRKVFRLGD